MFSESLDGFGIPLLLERNISNLQEIEGYIDGLVTENPKVDKWLKSNLRNYLIRDHKEADLIKDVSAESPDWMKRALEKGEEVFSVILTKSFMDKVKHAIDFLVSADAPSDLTRLTVPEAIKQSEKWVKSLVKKSKGATVGQAELFYEHDDGFYWVELKDAEALNYEGNKMGHCVGSYCQQVNLGKSRILSLRDLKDEPHCTIEINQNWISQIKGKQNKAVIPKYHRYVQELLEKKLSGFNADSREVENVGLIYVDGDFVKKSEVAKKIKENPELVRGLSFYSLFDKYELVRISGEIYTAEEVGPLLKSDAVLAARLYGEYPGAFGMLGLVRGGDKKVYDTEQFKEELKKNPSILPLSDFFGPDILKNSKIEGGNLVAFEGPFFDFLDQIRPHLVSSAKDLIPNEEDFFDGFDYYPSIDEAAPYAEELIDSLDDEDKSKVMAEITRAAVEAGLSQEGESPDIEDTILNGDVNEGLLDAIKSAVADGNNAGVGSEFWKGVKSFVGELSDGVAYVVASESTYRVEIPLAELADIYSKNEEYSLRLAHDNVRYYQREGFTGHGGFFDDVAAEERFPDALYDAGFLQKRQG